MVLGGAWSVSGSTGCFAVVIGQYGAVLVGTWWYWGSIGRYWLVCGGNGSVWGGTGWYLVVLGQYNLVLLGIKKYCVSKGLLCLYILKKVEIWSGVTIVGRRTRKDRATQPFDHRRLRRAICEQLP